MVAIPSTISSPSYSLYVPGFRVTWPKNLSFLVIMDPVVDFFHFVCLSLHLFLLFRLWVHDTLNVWYTLFKSCNMWFINLFRVQLSHAYVATGHTKLCKRRSAALFWLTCRDFSRSLCLGCADAICYTKTCSDFHFTFLRFNSPLTMPTMPAIQRNVYCK